jgi:uncharacterized membrane protein (GlpM family)
MREDVPENEVRATNRRPGGTRLADWLTVLVKGLAGGALVVTFAVLSEMLEPKRFAGLFGAAPAIALSSLTVVLATKGAHDARENTIGMLAGTAGMLTYALVTSRTLRSGSPILIPAFGLLAWLAPTALITAFLL